MPERGDTSRTLQTDQNRLRPRILAGGFAIELEEARWSSAYRNFTTRGIKSFADDLAVRKGPVSSRVALLLRSAEGKPFFASISQSRRRLARRRPGRREIDGWMGTAEVGESMLLSHTSRVSRRMGATRGRGWVQGKAEGRQPM